MYPLELYSAATAFESLGETLGADPLVLREQIVPRAAEMPAPILDADSDCVKKSRSQSPKGEPVPDDYFDDFREDLNDPQCVQRIYDFSLSQVRGMVDYNDEDDIIQEVFYRLHKWPIGNKYNSAKHYFSLLKITIRQAIAAYWKRRHSQRNDVRKRVFISQLQQDGQRAVEFPAQTSDVWRRLHLKDLVQRVVEKANTLSGVQRRMFRLRFLEEKSHEEIAQTLGISIRTSYRIETRIRETLQEFFPDVDLGVFKT